MRRVESLAPVPKRPKPKGGGGEIGSINVVQLLVAYINKGRWELLVEYINICNNEFAMMLLTLILANTLVGAISSEIAQGLDIYVANVGLNGEANRWVDEAD